MKAYRRINVLIDSEFYQMITGTEMHEPIGFLFLLLVLTDNRSISLELTTEKNSRAWFIVATFFQLNSLINAILTGFSFWSGPPSLKNVGNRFLSDSIGEDDP